MHITRHRSKTGMGSERKVSPWLIGALCLGLGLGLGAAGIGLARRQTGLPAEELERLTVEVGRSPLSIKIRANGSVVPVRSVNLSPKNAGRLVKVLVNQGDIVAAGDPIAEMESRDLNAQYLQAKARQAQAEARLQELRAGETDLVIDQGKEEVRQAQAQLGVETAVVREAQASVTEAQAGVQEAQASVAEAMAQLDLARVQLARNQQLKAEGAISTDRLDELTTAANRAAANLQRTQASLARAQTTKARAETARDRAQAGQAQAQSRLDSAQLRLQDTQNGTRPEQLEQAEAQVIETLGQVQAIEIQKDDSILRAPFPGIITQRYADPGAFVTPTTSASSTASATSTSVVALAQGLEIRANVPEVDITNIRPGQIVEVTADAFPEATFLGQVRLVSPEAVQEQNVTSFQVRVALTTGQEQLRSGMNVDLVFIGESLGSVLVVPTVAIVTREGQRGVLVPDRKNEPEFQPVETGTTIGDETQILSGVEVGERVFIDLPSDRRFQEAAE
ncbi:MAG: HlyD family efflux transporter periplasmic adaptor subunit [Synechococcales cyanobacterium RM1_1_8]|nr:HlyD family efflux transporter periplasmic adaptor subunit [Synechococcales cyanobacterium RM1_1_8]